MLSDSFSVLPGLRHYRLGSQMLSVYVAKDSLSTLEHVDVNFVEACVRRMRHHQGTCNADDDEQDDNDENSQSLFPPPSFACISLVQTSEDINLALHQESSCELVTHVPPPVSPFYPPQRYSSVIHACRFMTHYDVLAPAHLLPSIASDVTFELFTHAEIELQVGALCVAFEVV